MNQKEAAILVDRLAVAFPGATFGERNAEAYERALMHLDATETQAAIDELIGASKFLPSIAEIRGEITRSKRERALKDESRRALRIEDGSGRTMGPRPAAWRDPLRKMLDQQARHETTARAWYASKGKPYPGDPGAKFVNVAVAGARGDDVAEVFERVVLP